MNEIITQPSVSGKLYKKGYYLFTSSIESYMDVYLFLRLRLFIDRENFYSDIKNNIELRWCRKYVNIWNKSVALNKAPKF